LPDPTVIPRRLTVRYSLYARLVLAATTTLAACTDRGPTASSGVDLPSMPAAKLTSTVTVSNAVAATAQKRPPDGFPHAVVDCPGCYLARRDLSRVDLSGADLRGADLAQTDLSWADLRGADLSGADLSQALLDAADLGGATWVDGQTCADSSVGECAPAPEPVRELIDLSEAVMRESEAPASFELTAQDQTVFTAKALKWFGGHAAAVSITYDSAYGTWPVHTTTLEMVLDLGLRMDHEIVTSFYDTRRWRGLLPRLTRELLPYDIHLFGHGHRHVEHDTLSYQTIGLSKVVPRNHKI